MKTTMTAIALALIAAKTPARIVTDPPAIVELKARFRQLDERHQELKLEIERVIAEKAAIGQAMSQIKE